jgi:hypothetical protein
MKLSKTLRVTMKLSRTTQNLLNFAFISTTVLWSICIPIFSLSPAADVNNLIKVESRTGEFSNTDFLQIYVAGYTFVRNGQHIYDEAAQLNSINEIASPLHGTKAHLVNYPPVMWLIAAPFSLLPFNVSFVTWNIVSLLFGCSGLILLAKNFAPFKTAEQFLLLSFVLASQPAYNSLAYAQTGWFLLGIVAFLVLATLKNNSLVTGLMLALATLKPQYLPCLLIPLIVRRRWSALAWAAGFGIIFAQVISHFTGFRNLILYPWLLVTGGATKNVQTLPFLMVSLRGFFSDISAQHSLLLSIGALLFACIWIALLLIKNQSQNPVVEKKIISISTICAVLFSPHCHAYDLLIIAAILPLQLKSFRLFDHDSQEGVNQKICKIALLTLPILSWIDAFTAFGWATNNYFIYIFPLRLTTLALIALLVMIVRLPADS